ncbi:MAG: hypothetical protein GF398_00305 [Chitinivibrionales bacterium]|nr:hypothetical protein [Chitinivibrionales bacterium]
MKHFLTAAVAILALSSFQIAEAGEGCGGHHKKDVGREASLKKIDVGDYASKEDKLNAYKKKYGDVSYNELQKIIKGNKALIIDANSYEKFEKAHVTSAISYYDKKSLKDALPQNKNTLIVTYCGGPKCAAWTSVADYAASKGYTNIKHYSGGIKGWLAENGKKDSKTSES